MTDLALSPSEREASRRDIGPLLLITAGISYVFVGISFCHSGHYSDDRVLVAITLFISTLFCWFLGYITYKAAATPWSGLVWLLSVCEFLKSIYLSVYVMVPAPKEPVKGFVVGFGLVDCFATVFAVVLSVVAFYLISCMVRSDQIRVRSNRFVENLVQHLGEERLLSVLCFFVVFLYVTYFLCFALAFHDRSAAGGGLYMEEQKPRGAQAPLSLRETRDGCRRDDRSLAVQVVRFREDSALLDECTRKAIGQFGIKEAASDRPVASIAQDLLNVACKGENAGFDDLGPVDPADMREGNVQAFICVGAAAAKVSDYTRFRLTLLGHSDAQESAKFRSNYELSEARVRSTQLLLSQLLVRLEPTVQGPATDEPANVEWLPLPMSSEPVFLNPQRLAEPAGSAVQPSVEIEFQPILGDLTQLEMQRVRIHQQELNLLDYMYFMIYTITTTGYGDIKPISAQAKFLCSLANLLEIFFIVVIFNTLSNVKRST